MMKTLFTLLSLTLMFPAWGAPDNATPSVLIQTIALQKLPMGEKITAYGSIMPAMGATENISFPRAGQVARLYVLAGQVVKKGQPLLEFATDANAAALFRQAKTTVVFTRSELTRIEDMTARQLATQSQLAAARKAVQDAQANLAAQTGIGAGIATQRISASFDGVVSLLSIQQGDRVLPGMPILQLSRAGKLRATLGVEPEDIGRLRVGMTVQITSVFGNQPAVASKLLQIHGVINPLTRLVDVDIELQGATSGLLPGMQIRGTIILDNKASWVVPRAAVLRDEQGSFLYQVRAHHAVRVPVTTGVDSGEHTAVSGALDSKLPVVVSGNYELQDGMRVREARP
jgi:membrane fusion protein (multidrug efflux system)